VSLLRATFVADILLPIASYSLRITAVYLNNDNLIMYSTGQKHMFTMHCINVQRIIVVIKLQINVL